MSHRLQKFYSAFQGMDTRSNKLVSNEGSFRTGSRNFRYNFFDEIQKANGYQHKSSLGFTAVGDIEYRYTDIDTGEAKSQYLSVGTDGNLYRKRFQYLKFSSLGTSTTYSFYYDESLDTYVFKLNSYTAINVSDSMTMDQLRVAINALGATCTVVDENDVTVSGSTKLAYLIDVVIDQELSIGVVNEINSQFWEKVSSGGGYNDTPFTTTRDFNTDPNYQGISYVNINNSCVITDGGFPMKYDGLVVYRMGQPKILAPRQQSEPDATFAGVNYNYSGIFLTPTTVPYGNLSDNGTYQYVFQLCSVDSQGSTAVGGYDIGTTNLYIKQLVPMGRNAIQIYIPAISGNFNWFRCRINGAQNIADGGGTIDVYPNHNLVVGQTMRIPLSNRQLTAYFGNATTTSGSAIITGLTDTSRIRLGNLVTGTNIPSDSYVSTIDSDTQITLTQNASASGSISDLSIDGIDGFSYLMSNIYDVSYGFEGNGTSTSGSKVITSLSSTALMKVGALVSGINIASGSRITSIDSSTQITVDTNCTGTGTNTVTVYGTVTLQKGVTETEFSTISLQYPFQNYTFGPKINTNSGSTTVSFPVVTGTGGSVTTTSGSNICTIASTAGIMIGMFIDHTNLAAGTKVTEVTNATTFKVSANASASSSATGGFRYDYTGYYVSNNRVPEGTIITSQTGSSGVISNNATATDSFVYSQFFKEKTLLIDGQTISAGYVESKYQNVVTDVNVDNLFLPDIFEGCFLRVWRTTKDTDLFYHLIDLDIPLTPLTFNDVLGDTATYKGSTQPAPWTLSRISLTDAVQGSELPRACKYLSKWQDRLVQMGRPVDTTLKDSAYPTFYGVVPNNDWGDELSTFVGATYTESALCDFQSIYWSSSDSVESFPQDGAHEFKIESPFDDQIMGGAPNKDAFFAFKGRSTGVLVGSVADNNIQLELLEADVGLASHRSIQEINGSLVWLDSVNGFFSCVAGRLPVNIGYPINNYQKVNTLGLDWSKAVSGNFRKQNLYICGVEGTTFVFDYAAIDGKHRNCWYIWDRFNVKSLLATASDEFYLNDGSIQWKMKVTNTKYDFTDHKTAIPFVLNTAWLNQGYPTIDKQYVNLWVNSIQGGFTLDFYQYQNFLDYSIADITDVPFLAESSSKKLIKVQFKAANPKISGVSFGMQNNVKNAFVRIQGYEVEYSATFDSGEPRK